jgi:hypothetical protein
VHSFNLIQPCSVRVVDKHPARYAVGLATFFMPRAKGQNYVSQRLNSANGLTTIVERVVLGNTGKGFKDGEKSSC